MGLNKSEVHLGLKEAWIMIRRSSLLCMNWPESQAEHSCATKPSRSDAGLDISMQEIWLARQGSALHDGRYSVTVGVKIGIQEVHTAIKLAPFTLQLPQRLLASLAGESGFKEND